MISLKKALLALGIGIGLSAATMSVGAAPGCSSCKYMGEQCVAGDANQCKNFSRLGCYWYGDPGTVSCEIFPG
jgi:hypothetical protein